MSQSRSPTPIDTAITKYQPPPKSTQSAGASHESKSPSDDPPNTASTLFSPSAGFTERFMKSNSGGAYSTINTPISRLEMGDSDEELLIQKKRRVMHYDRMDSWVELVKSGTIRFAITVMFGTLLCVCLKAWEGFKKPCALSKYDVRIFNALTIAISICLGLNLLASLKRYAVILRWSILTKRPVNMEAFDLILGIEELGNVIKLLFLSMPGLRKYRWLVGKSRQYKNMNPGTNHWYATGCALWLLINIGSQILVACLSLFWPMNPYVCPLTQYGDVAVADLSEWIYKPGEESNPRLTAWRFGMDAQSWESYPADQDVTNLSTIPGSPYYQGDDYYEYRFFYRNPKNLYSDYLQSDRSLRSSASCTSYQIDGGLRRDNKTYIRVSLDGETWRNVILPVWGEGGMSFIGLTKKNCGPRCARINVFQLEDDETVNKTSYWQCESTVDKIAQSGLHTLPGLNSSDERIFGTDKFARYAAGSITWSGMRMNGWEDRQFQMYPRGTPWAPDHAVSTAELEQIISRFSIGAIAAFDDHGPRHNIHINNERCDADSQRLDVGWRYILGILGGIALIQFGALCYLLAFANKTIIRDASFFSTAMLLRPVLKLVEDEPGVMTMSGEEIKDLPRLRYRKIKYDFVSKTEGGPREVTVSVWPKGNFSRESMVQWPSGEYN